MVMNILTKWKSFKTHHRNNFAKITLEGKHLSVMKPCFSTSGREGSNKNADDTLISYCIHSDFIN